MKKTSDVILLILVTIDETPYSKTTEFPFDLYHEKNSNASITYIILAIA